MAKTDVIMPQMGESIAEGTIVKWLKKPGDAVKRDEPLFEISTDKVDAEIPSPAEGILAEIKVPEGQTVEVNVVVGTITDSASAAVTPAAPSAPAPAPAPAAPSPAASRPAAPAAAAATAASAARAASAPRPHDGGVATKEELQQTRSTPVVRRIAAEHGIDIAQVPGTGISGRVTKSDLLSFIDAGGPAVGPTPTGAPVVAPAPAAAPAAAAATPAPAPMPMPAAAPGSAPVFAAGQNVVVEPMSIMRKKIAEHMVMSKRTSAHVHTIYEIDCSNILKTRAAVQDEFVRTHGQKLTITPFVIKAAVESLRAVPVVNASVEGDNIVYKRDVNIGCAVALDWGLIVPVMHKADELSLVGINNRLADLANRARSKQLKPDEVAGGTFTITNPGIYGSMFGTPIINQPQVAILGMGMIEKRVKVTQDDAIVIKPMMYVCLSYDHRIVDGAVADQFLNHLKKTLETADFKALL